MPGADMTQAERRRFLIDRLLAEGSPYGTGTVPGDPGEQRRLLRGLMNVRRPAPIGEDFLAVQDEYLRAETAAKGVTDADTLPEAEPGICLWQGDITALRCGAIVNAANSGMTGCYVPGHNCIDNCIHTFAGIQLRLECARIMEKQGYPEPTGTAKITPGYALPCDWVLHTVGPIIEGAVTGEDERLLASCYRSCLDLAAEKNVQSVAFCCISTGVFRFPKAHAARVAVDTVRAWRREHRSDIKVIFVVHGGENYAIYRELLRTT